MIKENMKLYEALRDVPEEALKPITGGRLKNMSDINPMWRIKMLTEMYGPAGTGWYTEVTKQWLEEGSNGELAAFCNINLYVKNGTEWSTPIFGHGGSMFVVNEKNGPYTSDEAYKMAYTDAISVSCKALGMGANIYFAKDRTKYSDAGDRVTDVKTNNYKVATGNNEATPPASVSKPATKSNYNTKPKDHPLLKVTNQQIGERTKWMSDEQFSQATKIDDIDTCKAILEYWTDRSLGLGMKKDFILGLKNHIDGLFKQLKSNKPAAQEDPEDDYDYDPSAEDPDDLPI